MKKHLKFIIILLIQLIEKYEFKNKELEEDNPLKKISDIIPLKNKSVKSDYGFTPTSEIVKTIPLQRYELRLENGLKLECANNHIVYCKNHQAKFVHELSEKDFVISTIGLSRVKSIKKLQGKLTMFDLTIDGPEPSYYANGILNHNTVSAAIVILHFILFFNDKSCMIVANVSTTVIEIIDKIKSIYTHLPFFLKKGVINWNQRSITLDNGSRIKTSARTKTPAIGFAIDLLYFDEFAKVPANIIEPYYGAAVPTVSSIENSRIIITSTPEGFNLFHKLITDAEREFGDPHKNQYKPMRVYWYEVEGRKDTKLYPNIPLMNKFGVTEEEVQEFLADELGLKINVKQSLDETIYHVKYVAGDEDTHIIALRKTVYKNVPLAEMFLITNWKEEQTKLIGGEEQFKQEFDLHFITGNKLLVDEAMLDEMNENKEIFLYKEFDIMSKRLTIPYNNLKWIVNRPDLFNWAEVKKYYMVAGVDLAEGLGQDFTVMNIFRVMPKSPETIKKLYHKFDNIYDYFKLEQVGMFRSNIYSLKEFAHIFYQVMFDLLNPERGKVAVEYNTYGGEFFGHMLHVFDDVNEYSDAIFARYKHAQDAKFVKKGYKLTRTKNLLLKDLQNIIKTKKTIKLHNEVNIRELSTYTKHVTPSGNLIYKSESGNDDTVTSLLATSTLISNVAYKDLIDNYIQFELGGDVRSLIEEHVAKKDDGSTPDYDTVSNLRKKIYSQNRINNSPFIEKKPALNWGVPNYGKNYLPIKIN